ncbi:translocation protein TolB [Gammaproteobacteria bacterium 45_16_T64]|nr:translocation protein TolB [Gammaproteobacteria bacterium 45_16_T64]
MTPTRRSFLRTSVLSLLGALVLPRSSIGTGAGNDAPNLSALLPPDANGVRLPAGYRSRIIAITGSQVTPQSDYVWHKDPDGGATYATEDGGWVYVSNSEAYRPKRTGGVGAIRFNASGDIVDAYSILRGTTSNCAGGATPWNTWLSCEEYEKGQVWECDPFGKAPAIVRPALGTFAHEAVAVDTKHHQLYMTEDRPDSCLYRFTPKHISSGGKLDLSSGTLAVAIMNRSSSTVSWLPVPDPWAIREPARYQVSTAARFNGGEGIVYGSGIVSFATKGDNRIWAYDTNTQQLTIVYDASTHSNPILTGVDNVALNAKGELIVAEDGGDMQIVTLANNAVTPLLQVVGQSASEITGPAFSPDYSRLYFSSQRGKNGTYKGITYEITRES